LPRPGIEPQPPSPQSDAMATMTAPLNTLKLVF